MCGPARLAPAPVSQSNSSKSNSSCQRLLRRCGRGFSGHRCRASRAGGSSGGTYDSSQRSAVSRSLLSSPRSSHTPRHSGQTSMSTPRLETSRMGTSQSGQRTLRMPITPNPSWTVNAYDTVLTLLIASGNDPPPAPLRALAAFFHAERPAGPFPFAALEVVAHHEPRHVAKGLPGGPHGLSPHRAGGRGNRRLANVRRPAAYRRRTARACCAGDGARRGAGT